jgi:hypothetical protein
MMVKMVQLKKQGRSSAELIRDETKRMRNSIDMFLDTNRIDLQLGWRGGGSGTLARVPYFFLV